MPAYICHRCGLVVESDTEPSCPICERKLVMIIREKRDMLRSLSQGTSYMRRL